MKGRRPLATRASSCSLGARPPASTSRAGSRPSRPGLRNSKIEPSSPRWFSIGVPVSARRCLPVSRRQALAVCEVAFLIAWASSRITVSEVDGREIADVAADGAVCRDDQVGRGEFVPQLFAVAARVLQHLEVRRETGGLVDPVVHEAARRDDEVGQLRRPRGGFGTCGAGPAPGSSCPGPCRPPARRRGRTRAGSTANPGRGAGSCGARRRSCAAPSSA